MHGGAGNSSANIDNSGTIEVHAFAGSSSTFTAASFDQAHINSGIYQHVNGVNTGLVSLGNVESTSPMRLRASSKSPPRPSRGCLLAVADASIDVGIFQDGVILQTGTVSNQEGEVAVSLINEGDISIKALATAIHIAPPPLSVPPARLRQREHRHGIYQSADGGDVQRSFWKTSQQIAARA